MLQKYRDITTLEFEAKTQFICSLGYKLEFDFCIKTMSILSYQLVEN